MEKTVAMVLDKVTYQEQRTVNIGDYESVKASLMFSTSFININNTETVIVFNEMTHEIVHPTESFEDAATRAVRKVKAVLDKREWMIRKRTEDYVEFNTRGKAADLGLIKKKKQKVKKITKNDTDTFIDDEVEL